METSLSPREIQTRIRAGASIDDLTQESGMDPERVERFAAPVLAEREYVAATAGSCSARRRGETSGHRTLRAMVHAHLREHGVDLAAVSWDASRREDGRWRVAVDFGADRATFIYDQPGRFSVAGDDRARTLLGERPPRPESTQATKDRAHLADKADTEVTVDLDDELALIRAIQDSPAAADRLVGIGRTVDNPPPPEEAEEPEESEEPDESEGTASIPGVGEAEETEETEETEDRSDDVAVVADPEEAEPTVAVLRRVVSTALTQVTELRVAPGEAAVHPQVSDATAVPEVETPSFEASDSALNFPVEPEPEPEPDQDQLGSETRSDDAEQEALIPGPAPAPKPARRKRASVPSWDEIMFGGPKPG